jgi:hypothetical protein
MARGPPLGHGDEASRPVQWTVRRSQSHRPPPTGEEGSCRPYWAVEGQENLHTPERSTSVTRNLHAEQKQIPRLKKWDKNHLPRTLEPAPTLSILAIEGWACSNGLFSLSEEVMA